MKIPWPLVALGFLLAACTAPKEVQPRIVYIPKMADDGNSFWRTVREGVLSAAEDLGVDIVVRSTADETMIDGQIQIVEQTIKEKPAAIILAAADFWRLVPAVKHARAAGIPVVTVDSSIATDDASAKIGTDNRQMGRSAGAALLRVIGRGSVVGVLSYIKQSSTARDREQGLAEALLGSVYLLPTLYSDSDQETAYKQAKDLLATRKDLQGLIALNEPTTLGACQALKESGRQKEVALVGIDASFEVLKSLESGVLRSVLVQQPFNMGYLGVEVASKIVTHRSGPTSIDTGAIEITKATLFLPQNEKLLFPVTVLNSPHPVPNP